MEISLVGALAGVVGSLAGGGATIATAWITQKTHSRREMLRLDAAQARGTVRRVHRRMRAGC
jgi:uncharacterized membrane protein YfcA